MCCYIQVYQRHLWVGITAAPVSQCASFAIERSLTQRLPCIQRQDCPMVRKSDSGSRQPDFRSYLYHLLSCALGKVLNLSLAISFLLLFLNSFIEIHFTYHQIYLYTVQWFLVYLLSCATITMV